MDVKDKEILSMVLFTKLLTNLSADGHDPAILSMVLFTKLLTHHSTAHSVPRF